MACVARCTTVRLLPGRHSVPLRVALWWVLCSLCGGATNSARAQDLGPYFAPDALPRPGYELRLRVAYYQASRTNFGAPVFLFAQPPLRLDAHELRSELDLRIAVMPSLALQAVVPLVYRSTDVTLSEVVINDRQQLAPAVFNVSAFGVADPTLGLAYRFVHGDAVSAYAGLGARVPLDDNPGSTTLPSRMPLGTGQTAFHAEVGIALRGHPLSGGFAYRIVYAPGNAATYLVRRVGSQGYTSGSFGSSVGHRLTLEARYALTHALSLSLQPEWSVAEQPPLVSRNATFSVPGADARQELAAELSLHFKPSASHTLVLGYRHLFLESWKRDPFFPTAMPARGLSLTWEVTGY